MRLSPRAFSFLILVAGLIMSSTLGEAEEKKAPWKIHVDPGIESGKPYVEMTTSGSPQSLIFRLTTRDPGAGAGAFLKSQVFPPSTQVRFTMPEVAQDTYVELTVVNNGATTESLFRWTLMLRPEGSSILSYRGRQEMLPPSDFDASWNRARRQLADVALEPKITRMPDKDTSSGLFFRVELRAVEDTRIVCWYYVPRAAFDSGGKVVKKYPAIQIAPGYGAEEPPLDRTRDGYITLSMNPRNHGPSREFWKSPVEHMMYNIQDPEHYYYKLAFLDCLQGIQFLLGQPEVNAERVGVEGGSQGGLFALAAAALEPRVACVCSNVTAFSDYPDGMILGTLGHETQFREALGAAVPKDAESMRRSLAYTDGANLATRIHCPVQINMGGQDPVCPYVCGIVVHNRLPRGVEKEFNIYPDAKHEVPQTMREANARWMKQWLNP